LREFVQVGWECGALGLQSQRSSRLELARGKLQRGSPTSAEHILYRAFAPDSLHSHICIAVHPRIDEGVVSSCGCLSIAGKEVLDCLVKPLAQQPQIEDVEDWVSRRVSIETAERDIQQMDVTVIVVRKPAAGRDWPASHDQRRREAASPSHRLSATARRDQGEGRPRCARSL